MQSREGPVIFARHNLKAQGITCVNEVIPYVHYSRIVHRYIYKVFCIGAFTISLLFILWYNVQSLQRLLFCEFPVSLQEAVLGPLQ